jgi:hypothetical protein
MPLATDMLLGPDGYLNLIAPLFGDVVAVDEVVCHYRVHGSNMGPTSRHFSSSSLLQVCALEDEARFYLHYWIGRTGGPTGAYRRWRHPWRRLLTHLCLNRMGGFRQAPGFSELALSPFVVGETGLAKAMCLLPALTLIQLLPKAPSLLIARRLLQLPVD